jgi:SWI/SNF-related matrix-associated actin-dependent regulator 1 of chromatin subfamily A
MYYIDAEPTKLMVNPPPESFRFFLKSDGNVKDGLDVPRLFSEQLCAKVKEERLSCSLFDFLNFNRLLTDKSQVRLSNPAAKVLSDYYSQLNLVNKIKNGEYNKFIPPGLCKKEPWEDQKAAISFILARSRCGNFSDVGLGKTYACIYWYSILRKEGKARRGLVLCTNSIKNTWNIELDKYFNGSWYVAGNGTNKVLRDIDSFLSSKQDLLVIHYDALLSKDVVDLLSSASFDAMICDEAHMIQNLTSQRSKALVKIKESINPNNILFMTATPISESPMNAYCFLKVIEPDLVPTKTRFEEHFCTFKKIPILKKGQRVTPFTRWMNVVDKYKNLDELGRMLEIYSFRKTHAEVIGMPPTVHKVVQVEITGRQRMIYDAIASQIYSQLKASNIKLMRLDHALVRILRLRQFLSHPSLIGESGDSAKFEALDDLLDEILADPKAKVVLWSVWVDTIKLLTERYKHYGTLPYFGDVQPEERSRYENLFRLEDRFRILVANPQCAGLGLNLQRARVAIHVDRSEKLILCEQSDGRITRRDAVGTAIIIDLVGKNTIDEWLFGILKRKKEMKRTILDPDSIPMEVEVTSLEKYLKGSKDEASTNNPKSIEPQIQTI